MKPKFVEIIVREKSNGDFRGYCICEDDHGTWELRGFWSDNPASAAKGAYDAFLDYEYWSLQGRIIGE